MNEPVKLLMVFLNEADTWHSSPLYRAVVLKLQQAHIAGATAHAGLLGFGHHHHLHQRGLFGIPDDRPITITAIDQESKLRAVVPELRSMVREGLIVLVDAELVADQELPRRTPDQWP